jgi:hypothetical protein
MNPSLGGAIVGTFPSQGRRVVSLRAENHPMTWDNTYG